LADIGHLWLTSPAREILDVTFAMNSGWAKNRRSITGEQVASI
jgi:hypothetical protein